jgi:phosphoglycolate phosphatase-like HAD superfamily hydrolase
VQPLLVLWDVDHTLVNAGAGGVELYRLVLDELYGLSLPRPLPSMAGRTDRAIAADVLAAAGLPASERSRFNARLAARAPELASFVKERAIVLPGASEALAALARRDHGRMVLQSLLTGDGRAQGRRARADRFP